MASIINASTSSGLLVTPDTSGVIALQSNGTTIATISSTGLSTQVGSPAFSAYKTGDQSISTATWTKVTFTNEEFDTNNNFASSRFTPTVAGYYQINSSVYQYGTVTLTDGTVAIYKNGTIYKMGTQYHYTSSNGTYIGVVSSIVYLNGSTDYVEIYCYNNGSGTMYANEGTAGVSSWVNGSMIRSA